jgi:nucleoside-diphosphate-sugar epimerase
MKALVTGSAGFIGGYVVGELLERGYDVVGLDDHSRYGPVATSYDDHPGYRLIEGDARDPELLAALLDGCDHLVAGAATSAGVSSLQASAYDVLATNERIIASTCDAAVAAHRAGTLRKVTYLSSSMVFESAHSWPSYEGQELEIPPPASSYGFQKLAVEYFARAAHDQHGLPYTIVRPFNGVGVGELAAGRGDDLPRGNVKLAMSHAVPDLVQRAARGQDPLHLRGDGAQVRHYTDGADLADGIVTAMEHPLATNEDFNLSSREPTTVLELAENIWGRVNRDRPFRYVSDEPSARPVTRRIPSVEKAEELLGFQALTSLDEILDVVVPWVLGAIDRGLI